MICFVCHDAGIRLHFIVITIKRVETDISVFFDLSSDHGEASRNSILEPLS